jgi:hypothetical protein
MGGKLKIEHTKCEFHSTFVQLLQQTCLMHQFVHSWKSYGNICALQCRSLARVWLLLCRCAE